MKSKYSQYEIDKYQREMKEWAYKYPLTAAILNDEKLTEEEAMALVDLGISRRLI